MNYCSPEMREAINNKLDKIEIDLFKSDAFSFGLLFLNLWRAEKLSSYTSSENFDT